MDELQPTTLDLPDNFEQLLTNKINNKTKPIAALGQIELLAAQCARIQGTLTPEVQSCSLHLFAADHGMAAAGVSAYPQEVTRQMVLNFLAGGAAANVFARSVGASVQVIDAGITGEPIVHAALLDRRIANGTANAIEQAAMTRQHYEQALAAGHAIGISINSDVACFGEMGIGNTSAATLVVAKLLGQVVDNLVGRGTGLDDKGLRRKRSLLQQAASRTLTRLDAQTALCEYGGFEIAMMIGAMLGAIEQRKIVVVDGYIATAAALCAKELKPGCEYAFVFAHRSAETGHQAMLHALGATPLFDFGMRLGEGTGALLAYPIIQASVAMLCEMASFESANISGPT